MSTTRTVWSGWRLLAQPHAPSQAPTTALKPLMARRWISQSAGHSAQLYRRDRISLRSAESGPARLASRLNVLPATASPGRRCMASVSSQAGSLDADRCQDEYLESLMHRAGELTLKFTTIDSAGNILTEQGTFRKSDLCKQHDLDARDIRKLDTIQPNLVPTILSRRSAILVNMLHVRALIKADSVILFDPAGSSDSRLKERMLYHMQGNLKQLARLRSQAEAGQASAGELGLSYEHRALESVLVSVANALEEEMKYTRSIVGDLLSDLENDIDRENLKRLLHYSRRLTGFRGRTRYVLHSIEEVLESDEDLSAMYLTAKKQHQPRGLHDHEELELLLESFSKQVEEIVSEVEAITANMQSTQEIAELMLDANRNTLLGLDLKVSIATLGVGIGALTAGVFGMNLTSHFEQDAWAFYIVTGTAFAASVLISTIGFRRLRQIRRVGLNTSARTSPGSERSLMQRIREKVWRRAQTRSKPTNPVWINARADEARMKDAMREELLAEHRAELARLESSALSGKASLHKLGAARQLRHERSKGGGARDETGLDYSGPYALGRR